MPLTHAANRRRLFPALLALALAATACGAHTVATGTANGVAPANGSHRARDPSAATISDAGINVSRYALTHALYLSGRIMTLSPPEPRPAPPTSPDAAMAAITHSGLYSPDLATHSSSGLTFALFTDLGYGPIPKPGHKFHPTYVHHPVWYIEYHNVPFASSGPPPCLRPCTATPTSTSTPTTDVFLIVDALTDKPIQLMATHPSLMPPPSTTVNPQEAKASADPG